MSKWRLAAVVTLWAAAALLSTSTSFAQRNRRTNAGGGPAILDTRSVWHIFTYLKPPVIQYDNGPKPLTSPYQWVDKPTPLPPEGWNRIAFDDGSWLRTNATGEPQTPYAAQLFLRARFDVTDPAQVKDLNLSLSYHGGVIVYLNGEELGRGDLAKDAKGPDALAQAYPLDAFANAQGDLVGDRSAQAARERKLDLPIPSEKLKQGANVLAIQVIHAPYDKVVADYWAKRKEGRELGEKGLPYDLNWYTCELLDVRLTGSRAGAVSNAGRPKELQAWNSNLLNYDTYADMPDATQPLRPVSMEGARNGWFSGKIVISSPRAIEGLKVVCGAFKQSGGATIPASAMRARYGVPFDNDRADSQLESLLETPLDSFPVAAGGAAVVPIWFTVKIPADAKPGAYTGQATVEVKGEKTLTVPLALQVADYTLPDTQDYRTWIELMQSPDTLAAEYKVPLWSDQHWELIAQSMRYIGEIGSRTLQIPLIAQTNSGNAESMVRWIKKPDGTYDYDLSRVDKYLDYAEKYMGKPKFVAFIAWEIYLSAPKKEVKVASDPQKKGDVFATADFSSEGAWAAARWDLRDKGPAVTLFDPATNKTELGYLPRFEDPAAKAVWKPLFDELHRRMAKRGLEKTMILGMASDIFPNKQEMLTLEDVSGNLPWIDQGHGGNIVGSKLDGIAPIAYQSYVWNTEYPKDPPKNAQEENDPKTQRTYGWNRKELYVEFRRGALNNWHLPAIKLFPEIQITGGQRGLGRIGADFWPVLKDKRGDRRGWVWSYYPQSMWHSCQLYSHLLDPGPTGPVATAQYEAMREGMQEAEARIAIEKVLINNAAKSSLPPELAQSAQQLLDDRLREELKAFSGLQLTGRVYTTYQRYYNIFYYNAAGTAGSTWYRGSGWQDRAEQLYATAGEIQRKAGGK